MRLLALACLPLFLLPVHAAAGEPDVTAPEPPCQGWTVGWDSSLTCTVGERTFGCSWRTYQDGRVACALPVPCPTDLGAAVDLGFVYAGTDLCTAQAGTRSNSAAPCQATLYQDDPTTVSCTWGSLFGYDGVSCTLYHSDGTGDPTLVHCTPQAPCIVDDFWTEGIPHAGVWNQDCTYGAWTDPFPCETALSDPSTTTCGVGGHRFACTTGGLLVAYCSNDAVSCGTHPDTLTLPRATVTANTCRAGIVLA